MTCQRNLEYLHLWNKRRLSIKKGHSIFQLIHLTFFTCYEKSGYFILLPNREKTLVSRDRLNSLVRTGATVVMRGGGGGGGCDIVPNQSDWLIPEILQSDWLGTISPPLPPYYLYTFSLQTCLKFRECLTHRNNTAATTNGLFKVQTAPEMKV